MRRSGSRSGTRGGSRRAGVFAGAALFALVFLAAVTSSCDLTVSLNNLGGGCPPHQVKVPVEPDSGVIGAVAYCIDEAEVTNAQYAQFVSSGYTVAQAGVPAGADAASPPCASVTTTAPGSGGTYSLPGDEAFPVANVNWCQAYAYCKWAGKRLCGEIGGGPLASMYFQNPAESQWFNACSRGGTRSYPYSNTFDATACGVTAPGASVVNVKTQAGCVGGYAGIYDMSGNVWEWTDTCASEDPTAFCYALGGGFDSTAPELQCNGQRNWTRTSSAANIGIRCCMDL
jgi:sulfatase modifying factor 1